MTVGRIYSFGYEGLTLDALVERLVQSKVSVLFDVRLNAMSRRKRLLKEGTRSRPCQRRNRVPTRAAAWQPCGRTASPFVPATPLRVVPRCVHVGNGSRSAVEDLASRAAGDRVAVLCVERDRLSCHRQVITDMVLELDPEIEVLHLL